MGGSARLSSFVIRAFVIRHLASKVMSTLAGLPSSTVTSAVFVPRVSCQAVRVYLPGGRPRKVKVPSAPVTEKNGWSRTWIQAFIQGWTSHLILKTSADFIG